MYKKYDGSSASIHTPAVSITGLSGQSEVSESPPTLGHVREFIHKVREGIVLHKTVTEKKRESFSQRFPKPTSNYPSLDTYNNSIQVQEGILPKSDCDLYAIELRPSRLCTLPHQVFRYAFQLSK